MVTNGQKKSSRTLIGIAVDVSGSMRASIRNESGDNQSRLESFREALDHLVQEAKKTLDLKKEQKAESVVDLFIYGFGLKQKLEDADLFNIKVYDFLTLMRIGPSLLSGGDTKIDSEKYRELEALAHDYPRLTGLLQHPEARKIIQANPRRAKNLVKRLRDDPAAREKVATVVLGAVDAGEKAKTSAGIAGGGATGAAVAIATIGGPVGWIAGGVALLLVGIAGANAKSAVDGKDSAKKMLLEYSKEFNESIAFRLQETTLSIENAIDIIRDEKNVLNNADEWFYGDTPMKEALTEVKARFLKELSSRPADTTPILFLISDGEPTDGNPLQIVEDMKAHGIVIVSCFVTNGDLANPRVLFNAPEQTWNDGAKLMFKISSPLQEASPFHNFLTRKGWKICPNAKLFVQVNHSQVLAEFIRIILSPLEAIDSETLPRGI